MRYIFLLILIISFQSHALANIKERIIKNLENTDNFSFNFQQNINDKIENGKCIIQYPKKIICKYNLPNKKILVSNGKSLVVKTLSSYFLYPLDKTKLNYILDKQFLIQKIIDLDSRIIDKKFINFKFFEAESEINIFFEKENYDLIGWQTKDIYQNLNITYLSSIEKNKKLGTNLFKLPEQN